jgi:hypothetical protein
MATPTTTTNPSEHVARAQASLEQLIVTVNSVADGAWNTANFNQLTAAYSDAVRAHDAIGTEVWTVTGGAAQPSDEVMAAVDAIQAVKAQAAVRINGLFDYIRTTGDALLLHVDVDSWNHITVEPKRTR